MPEGGDRGVAPLDEGIGVRDSERSRVREEEPDPGSQGDSALPGEVVDEQREVDEWSVPRVEEGVRLAGSNAEEHGDLHHGASPDGKRQDDERFGTRLEPRPAVTRRRRPGRLLREQRVALAREGPGGIVSAPQAPDGDEKGLVLQEAAPSEFGHLPAATCFQPLDLRPAGRATRLKEGAPPGDLFPGAGGRPPSGRIGTLGSGSPRLRAPAITGAPRPRVRRGQGA